MTIIEALKSGKPFRLKTTNSNKGWGKWWRWGGTMDWDNAELYIPEESPVVFSLSEITSSDWEIKND